MRRDDAPAAKRIIELALSNTKAATISEIYGRIAPGDDGRIRTTLSPVGTETGRFSSADSFLERSTNLQNIPKKVAMLDPLFDVRSCIIAKPGHVLIEGDLSQAEARATSAYAADAAALEMFASGQDIHTWTASWIFGCPAEQVTKKLRHLGKMARHALNYGMGWALFLDEINGDADLTGIAISAAEAKRIVAAYHAANVALLQWWDRVWAEVQRDGFLVNAYGRRRDFLSPYVRKTDVVAFLPQSTIADLLNNRLVEIFEESKLADWTLLQIHDAVLLEVPESEAEDTAAELKARLEDETIDINGYLLKVPADVSVGKRWSEMEKVAA